MVIEEIRVRTVSVPFLEPVPWRFGRLDGVTALLVEVRTDSGVVGLGEAPALPSLGLVREALESLRSSLVGEDPRRVSRILRLAGQRGAQHSPHVSSVATAAVEMALWDICGKAAGRPAYELLGGLDADEVPFCWHVNVPDGRVATAREQASEGLRRGFTTLYLKAISDIADDLALARAVREEVGREVRLRLDPNEGWTRFEVKRALSELDELELEFLEQPLAMDDIAGAAELRACSRTPVAANQSAWRPADVFRVLEARAADVVVTGLHQAGGMAPLRDAVALCRVVGVPFVRHSLCELGVASAAAMHVLATLPPGQLAHQTHLPLVAHELVSPRPTFEQGHLRVPAARGLGIELDEEAVGECEEVFRCRGEFAGYLR